MHKMTELTAKQMWRGKKDINCVTIATKGIHHIETIFSVRFYYVATTEKN